MTVVERINDLLSWIENRKGEISHDALRENCAHALYEALTARGIPLANSFQQLEGLAALDAAAALVEDRDARGETRSMVFACAHDYRSLPGSRVVIGPNDDCCD